jgi:hypothetical protein
MPIANIISMCGLVVLMALSGCSDAKTERPKQSNRLGALAVLYGRYVATHGGRAPSDQQELVNFIKKTGEPILKQFGISQVEELFKPEDDGETIVVSYGYVNAADPNPIIAYASQPVHDKRRVLRSTGAIEEVAESDFQKNRPVATTK